MEKMKLKDFYCNLPEASYPKKEFLEEVASKAGVTTTTVQNWISGRTKADLRLYGSILSEITGIPQEELF